ncbi:L-glutamate gamma-semialdehyde dehydrogenase [Curvibacter delicatus]|jgi:RHH-type proline utilization regulon transcriptional repressor/proline dehydrogenase/delta 1-pyrroline-5-carboxylate dehydrogenase|uniref:L-glutamate gamma-semialdehyde dehydrogenase n=1 Tax=Curvibacter delicatus TaxID=80879 RepID=UPI0008371A8E|nr:L-glutamate gamma-semialdehyde dehydrogenase [Curvibacter delicatus]
MSTTARLPNPYRPEAEIVAQCLAVLDPQLDWPAVVRTAQPWVQAVRDRPPPFWAMERLLQEYPISSAEGLALMRLAEALLRVPDRETALALTADQLGRADFANAADPEGGLPARLSSAVIRRAKQLLPGGEASGLLARLGGHTAVAATLRAVQLLGRQFVLGQDMGQALQRAEALRATGRQLRFSFDMLGEGARTEADAQRYLARYAAAIDAIAAHRLAAAASCAERDGISVKLSALHPRYEAAQHARVMAELVPRVWSLCQRAAAADLNLTLDAEEVERLELSLDVFEALAARVAQHCPQWPGLGLALQAYQTRALALVQQVVAIARRHQVRIMCRLVKGAYWDAEIKRAQELGLPHYPVFTHKSHTDVSYLACAQALLQAGDAVYPQFASHNAGTLAAVLQLAGRQGTAFELQRLHGMGEGLYREVLQDRRIACRVYAPVGTQRDLLAYLVRRLLENGANSSFVHQLVDDALSLQALLASPLRLHAAPALPLPSDLFGAARANSLGVDLTVAAMRAPLLAAHAALVLPQVPVFDAKSASRAYEISADSYENWSALPAAERAAVLRRAAETLQARLPQFCALLVQEAFKTWGDAVAEVREAVDFLRYYAGEAERILQPVPLPGPTGEHNELRLRGRGVWVCISPWNFPLAIFTGQVAAALVTGNTVLAKPAEQTPVVAQAMVDVLHGAGVPAGALQLLPGPGETVGAALVALPGIAGVVFTGSTPVAKTIQRALAAKEGAIVPLIAETGGINAMLVDSSALPEQVVDAVVQSAFRSAGQRCSALRLLCLHEAIADGVIDMLRGAAQALVLGEPSDLATDVGPVIDRAACDTLQRQLQRLDAEAKVLLRLDDVAQAAINSVANWVPPAIYEVDAIERVQTEIFGPVLQVVRWRGDPAAVIGQINALGYGLTLGLQTRIDTRAQSLAAAAHIGNVYVNRNMIGAVVGVQPFGGEGLSGTGPKAGGPHYLVRFCAEQTVTVNTAAAGGNAALLAALS